MLKRIVKLIPKAYRGKGLIISLLVPFNAILDLIGLAALLPLLIAVLDSSSKEIMGISIPVNGENAIGMIIIVLLIILLKNLLRLSILNYQNKYLLSLYAYFSDSLFAKLYSKGLEYVKQSNSTRLSYKINSVCYSFGVGFLAAILNFVGESLFIILLLAALFIFDVRSGLLIIICFVPVVIIYLKTVKSKLKEYGQKEMLVRRDQQRVVQETFKGYPDMEINKAFPQVRKRFDKGLKEISRYRVKTILINAIPSYMMEFAVAIVVSALVIFSMNASDSSIRVFLGVFSIAVLRMLPSVKSLISKWNTIKSTQFSLEVLEELENTENIVDWTSKTKMPNSDNSVTPFTFEHEIKVENLSFYYQDDENNPILKNVSFDIKKGERFGIKGRTGSGKSTLFNLLLGLFTPTSGSIKIDGTTLSKENIDSWHKIIGYVPQDVFISDVTLLENIAIGQNKEDINREKVEKILRQVSLGDFLDSLKDGLDTMLGEAGSRISGGQRQRIGIARALYKNIEVLFFDEATSSLDTDTEKEINTAIEKLSNEQKRLTIIIISHRPDSLKFCDRIINIKKHEVEI
ncbi:MAG: ABC transporter ATP-binding protein [Bacteroidales bacterium]